MSHFTDPEAMDRTCPGCNPDVEDGRYCSECEALLRAPDVLLAELRESERALESCGAAEAHWRRRALSAEARADEAEQALEQTMTEVRGVSA